MRDINFLNIQMIDLELFLNVAKYGSFTKAGERMFLSQSRVSKRISQLEEELGLHLFYRDKRTVTLTPAGKVLAARLENVTDKVLNAIEEAHIIQTGMSGHIRFGFLEWGNSSFMEILEKFILDNPQVSIDICRNHFYELRNNLYSDYTDLILTTSYDAATFSDEEYNFMEMNKMPMYAYMNPKHPLAQKDMIKISDMRAEPLLMVDYKSAPGYSNYVNFLFQSKNIKPLIALYARNGGEHLGNILLNKGILLASQAFLENTWKEQIARVPIEDTEISITAVWKKSNTNPALQTFLNILE
ncbi:MAG: LysR family transcriptional regulator [Agathobacter sp.]